MGWWTVEGTEDLVGDDPFSILRRATREIARVYRSEFGRLPTRSEWRILVQDALEPVEELESSRAESLFREGGRPRVVEIVLETLPANEPGGIEQ